MNSVDCRQVLENRLLRHYKRFPEKNFMLQQDDAAIHISYSTMDCCQSTNIALWSGRLVYTHNRQFSSIEHLKKTVSKVWSKNGPVNLETLSMNMAERTFK
uniref:DDE-1 domain-containing protein n=1 Tax=Heterorhabditis bacteriophora TaxID=37862 RepID=A0A1I7XKM1_HETBA